MPGAALSSSEDAPLSDLNLRVQTHSLAWELHQLPAANYLAPLLPSSILGVKAAYSSSCLLLEVSSLFGSSTRLLRADCLASCGHCRLPNYSAGWGFAELRLTNITSSRSAPQGLYPLNQPSTIHVTIHYTLTSHKSPLSLCIKIVVAHRCFISVRPEHYHPDSISHIEFRVALCVLPQWAALAALLSLPILGTTHSPNPFPASNFGAVLIIRHHPQLRVWNNSHSCAVRRSSLTRLQLAFAAARSHPPGSHKLLLQLPLWQLNATWSTLAKNPILLVQTSPHTAAA